jgi:Flp pilus assembly protein TadG
MECKGTSAKKGVKGCEVVNAVTGKWRAKARARLRRAARRMRSAARAGSAALEFALIAPVFFVLLMGSVEVGVMFFGQTVLQNATNDAARLVRTGQITGTLPNQVLTPAQLAAGQVAGQPMTQAQFRTFICNEIAPVLACDGNLQIDVQAFSNFSAASYANPLTAGNTLDPSLNNFAPGNVCSVVLLRTFYTWSVITPLLTPFLTNMANSKHLMNATAAFRNEPYTTGVSGC